MDLGDLPDLGEPMGQQLLLGHQEPLDPRDLLDLTELMELMGRTELMGRMPPLGLQILQLYITELMTSGHHWLLHEMRSSTECRMDRDSRCIRLPEWETPFLMLANRRQLTGRITQEAGTVLG
jgi:hypothetical protein